MAKGTLEVQLIGAEGIKDPELFGRSDPYAFLSVGRKPPARSLTAEDQSTRPVWNQHFSFQVDEGDNQLYVRILNENSLNTDDEIGSAVIPLAPVFSAGKLPVQSYTVVRPSGRPQGVVKLSLTFSQKDKGAKAGAPGYAPAQPYPVHGGAYPSQGGAYPPQGGAYVPPPGSYVPPPGGAYPPQPVAPYPPPGGAHSGYPAYPPPAGQEKVKKDKSGHEGYGSSPYPPAGYPPAPGGYSTHPPAAYPDPAHAGGYPPQAYPPHAPQGYPPPQAYPPQTHGTPGYPPQGYPPQGYSTHGHAPQPYGYGHEGEKHKEGKDKHKDGKDKHKEGKDKHKEEHYGAAPGHGSAYGYPPAQHGQYYPAGYPSGEHYHGDSAHGHYKEGKKGKDKKHSKKGKKKESLVESILSMGIF